MLKRLWSRLSFGGQLRSVAGAVLVIAGAGAWSTGGVEAFPVWLEAVATLAAFGAAVIAARYAADVQRRESRRDKVRVRDQRRAQAELVAAWHEKMDRAEATKILGFGSGTDVPGIWLRNASPLPITDVRLKVWAHEGVTASSEDQWEFIGSDWISLVPPSDQPTFRPIWGDWLDTYEDIIGGWIRNGTVYSISREEDIFVVAVAMTFRDARGTRWRRDRHGVLARAGHDD